MAYPQVPSGAEPALSAGRKMVSWIWAFLPLATFGIATPFVLVYAALRLRTVWHWLALVLYSALWVVALVTSGAKDGSGKEALFLSTILVLMLAGTGHALATRSQAFSTVRRVPNGLDAAVGAAKERRATRERARKLAADDPTMARELRIGRPDLPRSFDDGGLIDVNSAPPDVLAQLPGMTPELVDRIVEARTQVDGFVSAEDLSVNAGLPPHLTDDIAEYAIFLT